jgi:hypothetical protein
MLAATVSLGTTAKKEQEASLLPLLKNHLRNLSKLRD